MNTRPRSVVYHFLCLALLVCGGVSGCAGANSEKTGAVTTATRIIIGFNSADINPEDPAVIRVIQDKLGMEAVLVRKLSGNAALYTVAPRCTDATLKQRLQQLTAIPYIRYAELDQRRHL